LEKVLFNGGVIFTGFNHNGGKKMNRDVLEGKWKQIRGRVREFWGDLTDDELDEIGGKRDRLVGKLQERYGYSRMEADREVDRFINDLDRDI
jgi:uncharacterized protein YjbJ (UPF0337 family)